MDNKLFYVHCIAALNIDFKKASDTVDWMKLGGGGLVIGIRSKMLKIIRGMYAWRYETMCIPYTWFHQIFLKSQTGVLWGDVLSSV